MDLLLLKACFYGVGVALSEPPESLRWLLEPALGDRRAVAGGEDHPGADVQ
ncbi:hypothetical protein [Streptomyces sp. NPDC047829]|uniref:hypothetical protein n=1 Tax=Streptomyces sp. NPDC047829 TaxID=3154609 RepID=UPI0033E7DBB7